MRRLEMSIQQHKKWKSSDPMNGSPVIGYSPWLEEVWFNYISNAIKYGGQPPLLELGCDILPEAMIRFWVKDNGHGFNQEDAEYIYATRKIAQTHRRTWAGVVHRVSRLSARVGQVGR